ANDRWRPEQRWRFPSPLRLGFDLHQAEQRKVQNVDANSLAFAAGLLPGDRVTGLAGACVMTASDVMFELDKFPYEGGRLNLEVQRDGERQRLLLDLPAAWKQGTPLSFSWRPFKWGFTPAPGFGGPALDREALLAAGVIKPDHQGDLPFALRVNYLVTWGENKRFGKAAESAGLRKNDIVTSIGGHTDFENPGHFHAWWRLTQQAGDKVELKILREGKALTLSVKVQG
ncbi:MAG: putative metalloprotease with PDZ domain, partial [Planctomycetota bacterium]